MQKNSYCCLLALCLFTGLVKADPSVRLEAGMVIKNSVTISPGQYRLNADSNSCIPLLQVEGQHIVIDFKDAILRGSNDRSKPDEYYGLAILIKKGSKDITIKNAFIHGYKIAIMADSVEQLTISNCNLGYNWRQQLHSSREREDISDWMSYHRNEKDEWLRYGAAIYLKNTKKSTITDNVVTGGQCALMMTGCHESEVYDNDFSFNSGIGIGLYRSTDNKIYHNRLDWNVRGFSYGKYWRGQDSAGILVFEQSSNNIFAYNTATHSGDGFFLWAGQSTMDKGEGGCNDNFIFGNDFSYAPTNGVEITFSRNQVIQNIIHECDHGVWGGYSFDTDITDNDFAGNRIGIAIEHGQGINIAMNHFLSDKTGIKLWSREKQPSDWMYARLRNTQSKNYWIAANKFTGNTLVYDIMGTDSIALSGNSKLGHTTGLQLGDRVDAIDTTRENDPLDMDYQKDQRLKQVKATQLPAFLSPKGKKEIRITEWGPYDFRYPLLWLTDIDSSGLYHFDVIGPQVAAGMHAAWQLRSAKGFEIVNKADAGFPSTITARANQAIADRSIQLSYDGPAYTNYLGEKQDTGIERLFSYTEYQPAAQWQIKWYQWDAMHDPNKDYNNFTSILNNTPIHSVTSNKIAYTWWGAIGEGLPADSFATVATSRFAVAAGRYEISLTADDMAKLFIDGKEVINAWDTKYTAYDEGTNHRIILALGAGEHDFRIVHAENTGLATLMFYIKPDTFAHNRR
ncbi:MAG: hypothetical protein NVSMB63_15180 [Sediminibacterium sp.]